VTDFRESTCRQYEENICSRAGLCNFMHLKPISRALRRTLFGRYKKRRSRSRSRSRDRGRDDRGRDRDREDRKVRETSAERRAKIAEWNKAKAQPKEEPAAAAEE
jgi:splicing factor U2AF subunit